MIDNISFGSTFRIPVSQPGINAAKKAKLRTLIESYPNGLIGKNKTGNARVSMPNSEDATFIQKLKTIGYKVFQKFEAEDVPKRDIDKYIKRALDNRDYHQLGKNRKSGKVTRTEYKPEQQVEETFSSYIEPNKKSDKVFSEPVKKETVVQPKSTALTDSTPKLRKPRLNYEPDPAVRARLRQTENYKKTVEEYGKEFAEAVYFGIIE